MKTKEKKQKELKTAKELIEKSEGVFFIEITKIPTKFINKLRQELKSDLGKILIIKKRLLNIGLKEVLKEATPNLNLSQIKTSFAGIFAPKLESTIGYVYKFLKNLEKEKALEGVDEKILLGYNFKNQKELPKDYLILIGNLPPREIALAQLLGIISSPLRSFMFILKEKAQRSSI